MVALPAERTDTLDGDANATAEPRSSATNFTVANNNIRATDILLSEIDRLPDIQYFGQVAGALGMLLHIEGGQKRLSIGDRCNVLKPDATGVAKHIPVEIIGFKDKQALAMPYGDVDGIGPGSRVQLGTAKPVVYPHNGWLGRVINALGEPVDGKGPLPQGHQPQAIKANPPAAHTRRRLGGRLDTGIRAFNTFLPCCAGQRLGIFAGSGVGKSTMMSMLARNSSADINVIGLVGERGREVQEFIQDNLGEEGLKKSVLVVATSDESPLMRRQAAYMTMAVSEYFRDQGQEVLCMMDSVTRFAMAQREVGLSAGEPPTSKGYPPTVFAELPRLLERAGPGADNTNPGQGNITGIFSVLVEGSDHDEPIADAVRGILDGHIVLDRTVAERGRYPAIDILRSISRSLPRCHDDAQNALLGQARKHLSAYEDMAELIRLGAYKHGTDPAVDASIQFNGPLESFLSQSMDEPTTLNDSFQQLAAALNTTLDDITGEA